MTKLGDIPSTRVLDALDFAQCMDFACPADAALAGAWTTSKYWTIPTKLQNRGYVVSLAFCSYYNSAVGGPFVVYNHIEEFTSAWYVPAELASNMYMNYANSHEVGAPSTQYWRVAAGASDWRWGIGQGSGVSDTYDYQGGCYIVVEE